MIYQVNDKQSNQKKTTILIIIFKISLNFKVHTAWLCHNASARQIMVSSQEKDNEGCCTTLRYESGGWKFSGFHRKDGSPDKAHAVNKRHRELKYSGKRTNPIEYLTWQSANLLLSLGEY